MDRMMVSVLSASRTGAALDAAADVRGESGWRVLYRIGGIAAAAVLVMVPLQIILYIVSPPPATVVGHFALMRESPLMGLIGLDVLYMISTIVVSVVMLALCVALRNADRSLTALALFLMVISTAVYFASSVAFEMLSLSARYAGAAAGAERDMITAAGEGMLATYQGSAFNVYYILCGIAGLIIAFVMMRSSVFSRKTAYIGLVMNLMMLVPPTAGKFGLALAFASLVPTVVWLVMISRRLLQLGAARVG
jgi:hypothetical protein